MKALLMGVVGLMFAATATAAPNDSMTWKELRNDSQTRIESSVTGFGPDGIFNVCASDSHLNSIKPVKVCTEYGYKAPQGEGDYGTYCKSVELRPVSQERRQVGSKCVSWRNDAGEVGTTECLKYEPVSIMIPKKHRLDVYFVGGEVEYLAFSKDFTIPDCR